MSQKQVTLFKYVTGGQEVTFLDDQGLYDAETIRKHWQSTFPELGNCQAETVTKKQTVTAKVEGVDKEVEIDRLITFVKKVGTKGHGEEPQIVARRDEAGEWGFHLVGDTARKLLIDSAPRMLAELQAQRDLLKSILEVAVFYNGNRQVVIDRLARLEAVIAEATGTESGDGQAA